MKHTVARPLEHAIAARIPRPRCGVVWAVNFHDEPLALRDEVADEALSDHDLPSKLHAFKLPRSKPGP